MDAEFLKWLALQFGFPSVVLGVVCIAIWRGCSWFGPRAIMVLERMAERFIKFLDELTEKLDSTDSGMKDVREVQREHGSKLDKIYDEVAHKRQAGGNR